MSVCISGNFLMDDPILQVLTGVYFPSKTCLCRMQRCVPLSVCARRSSEQTELSANPRLPAVLQKT